MPSMRLVIAVLVLLGTACTDTEGDRSEPQRPVGLVEAPPQLQEQCEVAADLLGLSVPCPRRVPTLDGMAMSCPPPDPAQESPLVSCVSPSGKAGASIFFVTFTGFDVDPRYQGVEGRPIGHLILEARRPEDSPRLPCFDGVRLRELSVNRWHVTEYECPDESARLLEESRLAQLAHAGHLLFAWSSSGINYAASAHGYSRENFDLLRSLVGSIELVEPVADRTSRTMQQP